MNYGGNSNSSSNNTSGQIPFGTSQKDRRAPLYNISARKNQMEQEHSGQQIDYASKAPTGNEMIGMKVQNTNNQILGNNSNNMMKLNNNFSNAMQIEVSKNGSASQAATNAIIAQSNAQLETLRVALRDAIDENEILRNRVTEVEALYAAAEDEIEKRDQCIQELVAQIDKLTTAADHTSSGQKALYIHKRNKSQ